MSVSIRIYPAGLASLRLGWFFATEESFRIEDIIEFLMRKEAFIEIAKRPSPKYSKLSIDELTTEYKRRLIRGVHREEFPLPPWEFSYSIVNIVKAIPLTLERNYTDVFLPLLCLDKQPKEGEHAVDNLARGGDELLLPGTRSVVVYIPSVACADLRKVRRWLRNIIELFSIQKYLIKEVEKMGISGIFRRLRGEFWLRKLRRGILPPTIEHLFSVWNYLNLHFQRGPLKKGWRTRYQKILKIMDKNDEIRNSRDQAWGLVQGTVNEAVKASQEVSESLKTWIDRVLAWAKPFV